MTGISSKFIKSQIYYKIHMKKIIEYILKFLSKKIIGRYQPEIIGITGSVGKTSAKEAIYAVLKNRGKVRRSEKNYNNEIGLPLTIIGADSPGRSIFGWMKVFAQGFKLAYLEKSDYPKILILEMGADKPGDIAYLLGIVKCHFGVITRIGQAHLEAFKTIEAIKKEKGQLVTHLGKGDWAVLNADDERVASFSKEIEANYVTYGIDNDADLRAKECVLSFQDKDGLKSGDPAEIRGISFKLLYQGSFVPVLLPGAVGFQAVYAALAAAAIGVTKGMNLVEISQSFKDYEQPRGRMRAIGGVKHTLIIDDTYNSSPSSSILALKLLSTIPLGETAKRWAVFGDMLELGNYSEEGHRQVGKATAKSGVDFLIAVGERARDIARGAAGAGMKSEFIFEFGDKESAGKFLEQKIKQGDIILVKASQGARMEKIVKEIMADPLKAEELLVRQGKEWEKG
jgi:UDP-N-acetylmuramoyl-tripeptide--D-alanyl-D-alanine ligase